MRNYKNTSDFTENDLLSTLLLELNATDSNSSVIIETLENAVKIDINDYLDLYSAIDSLMLINESVYDSELDLVELFDKYDTCKQVSKFRIIL